MREPAAFVRHGYHVELHVERPSILAVIGDRHAAGFPPRKRGSEPVEFGAGRTRPLQDARRQTDDLHGGIPAHALEGRVHPHDARAGQRKRLGLGDEDDVVQARERLLDERQRHFVGRRHATGDNFVTSVSASAPLLNAVNGPWANITPT